MSTPANTNTAAVVSLVSGILAWLGVPVLGAVVAVFTGHVALKQIRASRGFESGHGLAIAGLILGWTQAGLLLLALAGWILFAVFAGLVGGLVLMILVGVGLLMVSGLAALFWMIFLGVA